MPITDYGETRVLDALLGSSKSSVIPGTLYVALFRAEPADDGTGADEVPTSGTGYSRVSVTNNDTNWPAATTNIKLNATTITFPPASSGWGTIVAVGFYDASTAGNLLWWGQLGTPITVTTGASPFFSANSLGMFVD